MIKKDKGLKRNPEDDQKIITLLQFAHKAGKLISGNDAVLRHARTGKVKLIILMEDLSFQSRKKILYLNQSLNIPVSVWGSKKDTMQFAPKESGILAITDVNFAKGLLKYLAYNEVEE